MTSTYSVIAPAVRTQLTGGTALIAALGGTFIYSDMAPDGQAIPFLLYSQQAGGAENITPSDMRSTLIYIRAYAVSREAAESLASLIFDRMNKTAMSVTGFTNFWTALETEVSLIEHNPAGVASYVAGGMYRIRIDE